MIIEKTAKLKNNGLKKLYYFKCARDAFKKILKYYKTLDNYILLLPGYIGISPNEGSGIYDPVIETGIEHCFYKMDKNLNIDIDDMELKLKNSDLPKIVLLVHYFGFPDVKIEMVIELCKKYNAIIIEDAAHALYTDFIDHSCGNYGDYTLYSLHKMLPLEDGGLLKCNIETKFVSDDVDVDKYPVFDYDLYYISQLRKKNAKLWLTLLSEQKGIKIMRPCLDNVTPQTFPIIIETYDRNELYFKLNEIGFGAVSLYHTMIDAVKQEEYKNSIWLSKHIINMPVHQDINSEKIKQMSQSLLEIVLK